MVVGRQPDVVGLEVASSGPPSTKSGSPGPDCGANQGVIEVNVGDQGQQKRQMGSRNAERSAAHQRSALPGAKLSSRVVEE